MIKVFTDGSFKVDHLNDSSKSIIGGSGVVIQHIDQSYNEIVSENYYAFRYNQQELLDKVSNDEGYFQCFDSLTSTMVECLAFAEAINIIKLDILSEETIDIYSDDNNLCLLFNTYKEMVLNNYTEEMIKANEKYGCYMCIIHNLMKDLNAYITNITITHIEAHKDNHYNNMADYLAYFNSNPYKRIATILFAEADLSEVRNRKIYYETLGDMLNIQF